MTTIHDEAHHDDPAPDPAVRAAALERELEARGVLSVEEVDEHSHQAPASSAFLEGRRVVARAWADPAFRDRLLADASAAIGELGLTVASGHQPGLELVAVANTPEVHNLVVCTLCSCYPRALLGPPPGWYASEAYRSRAVREPRELLAEFGVELAPGVAVRVWDSTADTRYLVVPERPAGTGGWTEDELAELVTADALIGAARPTAATRET